MRGKPTTIGLAVVVPTQEIGGSKYLGKEVSRKERRREIEKERGQRVRGLPCSWI